MAGRKIGVGFNNLRVLDGRRQYDWRVRNASMRQLMTYWRVPLRSRYTTPASLVDTIRHFCFNRRDDRC